MLRAKIFHRLDLKRILILIGYPLFLAISLELLLQEISFSSGLNFLENVLFSILTLLVIDLLAYSKIGRRISILILVLFYTILFLETGLYVLFQSRINAAYIHVVLNTNLQEIKEFSSIYFKNNLIWLIFFFLPTLNFFSKKIFREEKIKAKEASIKLFLILIIIILLKFAQLTKWNFPWVAIKSYVQYKEQMKVFNDFEKRDLNINVDVTTNNEVIVVVIGESTSRNHMGIYGYKRKTTPNLNIQADSLIIYNDVVSSHVYTTASIFDAFTFTFEDKNEFLIDYIKKSGYKTYWLSNQRPVGLNDNIVAKIASGADESIFLSYNDFRHKTFFDQVLFPMIDEKLALREKQVVFVHLIGTHYDYSKRYPSNFNKFNSKENTKKNKIIDSYDNAILYNDFIVSEIIKKVQASNKKGAVVYFSDHGEEVYDTKDFFGHFEDKVSSSMYEIPFLLYMTSNFEKPDDFSINTNSPYVLDDFPFSLTHLMGIESNSLKKSKSIFNNNFESKPRYFYDSLILKH